MELFATLDPQDVPPEEMYALSRMIRDLSDGELKKFLTILLDGLDDGKVMYLMSNKEED